jgi:hypothetical protein
MVTVIDTPFGYIRYNIDVLYSGLNQLVWDDRPAL